MPLCNSQVLFDSTSLLTASDTDATHLDLALITVILFAIFAHKQVDDSGNYKGFVVLKETQNS